MTVSEVTHRLPVVEDYAKAIYSLGVDGASPVATSRLAERLGVTPGSVSAVVHKLDGLGLASHTPYRGVSLTADGRRVAPEVIRHHRLLELLLSEVLEMPWDRVHAEAEVLEHASLRNSRRRSPPSSETRRANPTANRFPPRTSSSRSARPAA